MMKNKISKFKNKSHIVKLGIIMAMSVSIMSACTREVPDTVKEPKPVPSETIVKDKEENKGIGFGNEKNARMIADALNIDADSRSIRFIANSLDAINVGTIRSAEIEESDGEKVLNIINEEDVSYSVYLSDSQKVEAIKNVTTGEWVMKSDR